MFVIEGIFSYLFQTTNLNDLIQHMSKIDSAINAMLNNLKTLLEDKGFDVGENLKLSVLIKSVKELDIKLKNFITGILFE